MSRLTEWIGGRKWTALYVALALLTAMAFPLDASFTEYAMAVGATLAWVTAAGVKEDNARHRAGSEVR